MRSVQSLLLVFIAILTHCSIPARTAEVVSLGCQSGFENYLVRGEISAGDRDKIKRILQSLRARHDAGTVGQCGRVRLSLDSPGGSFGEAMEIATLVWFAHAATYVSEKAKCLSACALIFMGGSAHAGDGYTKTDRVIHYSAKLGFHAPYLSATNFREMSENELRELPVEAFKGALDEAAKLLRFASRSGSLPPSLVEEMFEVPKDRFIYADTIDRITRWNIAVDGLPHDIAITVDDLAGMCANHHHWFGRDGIPKSLDEIGRIEPPLASTAHQTMKKELLKTVSKAPSTNDRIIYEFSTGDYGMNCKFDVSVDGRELFAAPFLQISSLKYAPTGMLYSLPPITTLSEAASLLAARRQQNLASGQLKEVSPPPITYWDHNGSRMRITISIRPNGSEIMIHYDIPRSGIAQNDVKPGTLFLDGTIVKEHLAGDARTFRRGCAPLTYLVNAKITDIYNLPSPLILNGPALKFGSGCARGSWAHDPKDSRLVFTRQPD